MSKQQYEQFLAEKIQQGQKDIAQEKTVTLEQSRQAVEQLLIRKEQELQASKNRLAYD